jgi:2,4-dienoyl-CoA reductase-like NADH-dependent reductase (Old Yellow Enzyme family)
MPLLPALGRVRLEFAPAPPPDRTAPAIKCESTGCNGYIRGVRGQGAAITSIDKLIGMVVRDEVDLVAVGRALLVDPAWATKVRDNRMQELLPFTAESLRFLS